MAGGGSGGSQPRAGTLEDAPCAKQGLGAWAGSGGASPGPPQHLLTPSLCCLPPSAGEGERAPPSNDGSPSHETFRAKAFQPACKPAFPSLRPCPPPPHISPQQLPLRLRLPCPAVVSLSCGCIPIPWLHLHPVALFPYHGCVPIPQLCPHPMVLSPSQGCVPIPWPCPCPVVVSPSHSCAPIP